MLRRLRVKYRVFIRPFFLENRWLLLFIVGTVTMVLGYQGFDIVSRAAGNNLSPWDLLYETAKLFKLGYNPEYAQVIPWQLNVARYLAIVSSIFTISVLILIAFHKQINYFWLRVITHNHVIICGLGLVGPEIAQKLLAKGFQVVVIEKDPSNKELDVCWENGAVVIVGDASEEQILRKAQVSKASCLFAVTGSDEINSKIALLSRQLAIEGSPYIHAREGGALDHRGPLNCYVHIVDPHLANFLKVEQMATIRNDVFRLEFFSIYQVASYCLLNSFPAFEEKVANTLSPHVLIIGLGRMGISLAAQLVKRWKANSNNASQRIRVTCIDREAEVKVEMLRSRYPSLDRYSDLTPLAMDFDSLAFQNARFLMKSGTPDVSAVYICLADESRGLSTALHFHQILQNPDIPIILRTVSSEGFARLFNDLNKDTVEFSNLKVFPLISCNCCHDLIIRGTHELIAMAIHDEYRALQEARGDTPESNPSLCPWGSLPLEIKDSNRRQADHIWTKLEKIRCGIMVLTDWEIPLFKFTPEEIEFLAKEEHLRWMQEKIHSGYQYGVARNNETREHPSMVPWEKLPEEEKEKDRNAVRTIPGILAKVDLQIVRFRNKQGS
jgi:voltage-gated potassium channel Kch